ncbi:hypothetical protein VE01_04047 [Pseudogymnoascus verrucosus]|uniref:Peptidase S1 domain-containing protein n=1 Tax=Pseudogymnoascus verrucosus TaxID=342668 RepID=A0A1B8GQD7_9PEZI|nr:uncharacterized protein VE01_04047 [Pseudogymnoascus verrucosus]OBT98034.2 hypothetical protein VE01_04047 [Pseudogymnoascus verrucosus]
MDVEFRDDRRLIGSHKRRLSYICTMDAASEVLPVTTKEGIVQFTGSIDHEKNRTLGVIKHRRSTGWTCGTLNELRSDCRHVLPGQLDLIRTEWCVFKLPRVEYFSSKGDSGAAVIDFGGKIVGMVHRSSAKSELYRAEMTYVTPMDWIIEDIKATMGTDDVILEEYIWDGEGETGN